MPDRPRAVLGLADYRSELLALVDPDPRRETVALAAALGRVLATEVHAGVANPAFDNSAMDGYAVRFDEVAAAPVRLRVVADVGAGSAADPRFGPGECVRIMTGAALPGAADTVVPVEHTDGGTTVVEVRVAPTGPGAHVRRAGDDYPAGALVAAAGTRVTPAVVGALAAAGSVEVAVRPRPVVAVSATGDELVADGSPLGRGQLYDSNSPALAAALRRDGAEVVRGGPIPDDPRALAGWLDAVTPAADLVLLTGGASVGAFDVVRDVLTERADGVFRHVRMQPGKPQGWAVWNGTPVLAFPGNPLSAALSYQVFGRALLRRILGEPAPVRLVARAAVGWQSPAGRAQLVPVILSTSAAALLEARPVHARGSASHLVSPLAGADAIALVAEDATAVAPGDLLDVAVLE